MSELPDHVFGPVPSRRLGKSLGINNIPAKVCSYSCIYCQLGRTIELSVRRRSFYDPEELVKEVREKLETYRGKLDYITFVPDGEPTLDENLGVEVKLLREITDIPIAILTNASLIFLEKVGEDLMDLDLVSLKVDAISKKTWVKINRPHPSLSLDEILKGIQSFSKEFS
ncbi:MAG: radical SAM protein, partial [Candidatus Wolframiiraptor sp.]